jgi:hypothetical protein
MDAVIGSYSAPPSLRNIKAPDRLQEPSRMRLTAPPIVIYPPADAHATPKMLAFTAGQFNRLPTIPLEDSSQSAVVPQTVPLEDSSKTTLVSSLHGGPSPCKPGSAELKRRRERATSFAACAKDLPASSAKRACVGAVIGEMLKERAKDQAHAAKHTKGKKPDVVAEPPSATPKKVAPLATPKKMVAEKLVAKNLAIDWEPIPLKGTPERWCKTTYNHHKDRQEVVLRSGFRGLGQSKTIKYGKAGAYFGTAEEAIDAATLWVSKQ